MANSLYARGKQRMLEKPDHEPEIHEASHEHLTQ